MKIVCIADTHGLHDQIDVPDGDILIIAGDIANKGTLIEMWQFGFWLKMLPHEHKIVIAGNHDFCFLDKLGGLINAIYLENSGCEIEGIKFWGFPYTKIFRNWAYMLDDKKMKKEIKKIPNDIDVLISHGPPLGILDRDEYGQNLGEKEIRNYIDQYLPKFHIFGHIHEGYGVLKDINTHFVNCSICNEDYKPINRPIVIEI